MKLIINQEKMFKVSIAQDGQMNIALANGKQIAGALTPAELEQVMHRVSVVSEGTITFDPTPNDYVSMHNDDVKTLELQSSTINELREQLQARDATIEKHAEVVSRLADCENELSNARNELKDALLVVEQQAAKLNLLQPPAEETAAEETSAEETTAEEKSAEESVTEPTTESADTPSPTT